MRKTISRAMSEMKEFGAVMTPVAPKATQGDPEVKGNGGAGALQGGYGSRSDSTTGADVVALLPAGCFVTENGFECDTWVDPDGIQTFVTSNCGDFACTVGDTVFECFPGGSGIVCTANTMARETRGAA